MSKHNQASQSNKLLAITLSALQAVLILTSAPPDTRASEPVIPPEGDTLNSLSGMSGVREWPAAHPRAIVCAVHETTQQSGCFESLSRYLNAAGFTLVAMDLRAHGYWFHEADQSQSRARLDYSRSAQDLQQLAVRVKKCSPSLPLFCIGESVGAGVATLAASRAPDLFAGIILASPGTRPNLFNPLMVARDFFEGITDLDRQLDVSGYITRYSSEDARITKEMCTDKLSRTTLSGKEILKTAAFIRRTPRFASLLPPQTRVLVLQGKDDHMVRLSSIKAILRKVPSSDKKLVVFPNCGHILLGTAYLKEPVLQTLVGWLKKETNGTARAELTDSGRAIKTAAQSTAAADHL